MIEQIPKQKCLHYFYTIPILVGEKKLSVWWNRMVASLSLNNALFISIHGFICSSFISVCNIVTPRVLQQETSLYRIQWISKLKGYLRMFLCFLILLCYKKTNTFFSYIVFDMFPNVQGVFCLFCSCMLVFDWGICKFRQKRFPVACKITFYIVIMIGLGS